MVSVSPRGYQHPLLFYQLMQFAHRSGVVKRRRGYLHPECSLQSWWRILSRRSRGYECEGKYIFPSDYWTRWLTFMDRYGASNCESYVTFFPVTQARSVLLIIPQMGNLLFLVPWMAMPSFGTYVLSIISALEPQSLQPRPKSLLTQ